MKVDGTINHPWRIDPRDEEFFGILDAKNQHVAAVQNIEHARLVVRLINEFAENFMKSSITVTEPKS